MSRREQQQRNKASVWCNYKHLYACMNVCSVVGVCVGSEAKKKMHKTRK